MCTNLRRSVLYVPGDSEKMLQRSAGVASDLLLLNLEDGVAASRKEAARELVIRALRTLDLNGRETAVRINNPGSATGMKDLTSIIPLRPDGICLPKIESASDIKNVDIAILQLEIETGIPEGTVRLHAMIESAAGVLRSPEIAAASARMASLIFGSADYAADVRCQPHENREELALALQMIVNAARSAGIDAIDAPCFDIKNQDLLLREASQARRLGYDGKSALHPDQLAIINQIFDVTPEEVAWARQVLQELDLAENRGKALTTIGGILIDNPHRAAAERILKRSRIGGL
jgi:citrate lyase subunit beta / citryl-CoA lyase